MPKYTNCTHFFSLCIVLILAPVADAEEITVSEIRKVDFSGNDVLHIVANPKQGFNFPYYLFIPKTVKREKAGYWLGLCFMKTGEHRHALIEFQHLRKRFPKSALGPRIRKRIAECRRALTTRPAYPARRPPT